MKSVGKISRTAGVALPVLGFLMSVWFTMLVWNTPWPDPILTIDGRSYLQSAAGASWATLFSVQDIYHSPGYTVYLRFLVAALGSVEAAIDASKLLSLLMFVVSAALLYRLARRWFQVEVARLALGIFSISASWRYYCNMMQYEVLAGFLMLVFLAILVRDGEAPSPNALIGRRIAMGFVLAFIALIQVRYVALLIVPPIYAILAGRNRAWLHRLREQWLTLVIAMAPLVAWSFFQSMSRGRFIFLMEGSDYRFHLANNPNAAGYSFPYPQIVEPSGWQFIVSTPGRWLWLIGQRILYLLGIKRDIWALPPNPLLDQIGSYSIIDAVGMVAFFAGMLLIVNRVRRKQCSIELTAALLLLASVLLPPLMLFGSKRFIIPVIPVVALFQAYALVAAIERRGFT